ncbi:hypothetical protein OH76DRAFT_1016092 [Lentinus brumalis]|uniref:Uncharacterized protein n=1 Tax=Lentinus brumalis TaxID=2498619 RepID=A0A371CY04_9APHY|nr:hypothetical protein OH76DRAFT_1016092 [Polyporus brumalis]
MGFSRCGDFARPVFFLCSPGVHPDFLILDTYTAYNRSKKDAVSSVCWHLLNVIASESCAVNSRLPSATVTVLLFLPRIDFELTQSTGRLFFRWLSIASLRSKYAGTRSGYLSASATDTAGFYRCRSAHHWQQLSSGALGCAIISLLERSPLALQDRRMSQNM